jgi:hypothetical protein
MQSDTIGALAAALAKAQGAMKPAPMDRNNPFFNSKYATLTSLWDSARAALSANGLAVTQVTDFDANGNIVLITTLIHSSGEWMGGVYPVKPTDNKPQTLGSALTYARRYAFGALVGLTSDDDDDGNGAQNGTQAKPQQAQQAPTKPATNGNGATKVPAQSNALKAFQARGTEVFGADWDTARGWLIERYTAKETPDNVRHSSKDLTDVELNALRSNMDEYTKGILKAWDARRAELNAITVNGAQEMVPA